MSVEDIQKVNQLAQEYLDQGFADSREEAVKKAEETLNKDLGIGTLQEKHAEETSSDKGDSENLRNMITRTKEYMERQFVGYKNALLGLEKEIGVLKQQIVDLSARGERRAAQKSEVSDANVQEAAQQEEQKELPQDKKESNPRTGNHTSDEVSIEKMFYYGNK